MKNKFSTKLILLCVLILAAFFRFYNLNWDSGHQMHPDERAIVMAVDKLEFPNSASEFLSSTSSWNPNFFAYGSFPMYSLRATGDVLSVFNPAINQYNSLNVLGRFISTLADLGTIILLFLIARKLFNSKVGLLASFFYALCVLPIQLSHFYAVDTLLTCFVMSSLYSLLKFYEKPNFKTSVLVGLFFGMSLATKVSAIVLIASIGFALTVDFILIFLKTPHRPRHYLPHLPKSVKHLLRYGLIIGITTLASFLFFEPYALIDFNNFWAQTLAQSELTKNPFYFPYTLQFVGKIPYVYEFKNIFLWGLGPVLATLSFAGAIYFIITIITRSYFSNEHSELRNNNLAMKQFSNSLSQELIIFVFFFIYVLVVGRFAVGFMRYMLPVYPLFALFAAILFYRLTQTLSAKIKNKNILYFLLLISHLSFLIWPLSFIQIYSKPNTRIQASNWIYSNIPANKTLAIEHWDDQLPIGGQINYHVSTLKLYDPDTREKWDEINDQLEKTDYIILASNRLYTPLQKLTDCQKLPAFRCYPRTAYYYKQLFSGELGFEKVAEFTSYPTIPLLNLPINDQASDENFTVFDHPKVMIFKKMKPRSTM